ncbi:MAG: hypothetical protein J0M19_01540 [Sphingomonadales bacterium]|nr:hypothetical protein [Sphingomonadales bacterium]
MNKAIRKPLALIATALWATMAQASGTIPAPEVQQTLPSFRACLAQLDAAYAADRKAITPRSVAADGRTSEVSLETRTKGIARSGRNQARYHGRIWYAHGRISTADPQQREVSHSWQERVLVCDGRKLTRTGASGYTLSTFEPVGRQDTPPAH